MTVKELIKKLQKLEFQDVDCLLFDDGSTLIDLKMNSDNDAVLFHFESEA
jgi:hypothetical protein